MSKAKTTYIKSKNHICQKQGRHLSKEKQERGDSKKGKDDGK
jgi:hypothetical protein